MQHTISLNQTPWQTLTVERPRTRRERQDFPKYDPRVHRSFTGPVQARLIRGGQLIRTIAFPLCGRPVSH